MRLWVWGLSLVLLVACKGAPQAPPADGGQTVTSAPAPLATPASKATLAPVSLEPVDWAGIVQADTECVDCHPDEAAAWAKSKMGNSFKRVDETHAPFGTKGQLMHPVTRFGYGQGMGRFVEWSGGHRYDQIAQYSVGSGSHAHSYLWANEHQLFELPLTWYTQKAQWDFSPGYNRGGHPGSFRAVAAGCVSCHANPVPTQPGTKAYFSKLPDGPFSCVRCHGDGRAHAAAQLDGKQAPIATSTSLGTARANDVCGLCHFPGAARVLRDGRAWSDFVPGRALEDVVAVFVRKVPTKGFGSTSHHHRLAMSACSKGTPELKCTTCHAPHPTGAARDRSAGCRDCHSGQGAAVKHACSGPAGDDCAQCHMDVGQTQNIPHVSATDHFIRLNPKAQPPENNDSPLVWVAHPEVAPTDPDHQVLLGRAYVEAWRADGQPEDARRAERWLEMGLKALPNRVDGWLEWATLRRLTGDKAGEKVAAEHAFTLRPTDRRVALLTAGARLEAGDSAGALAALVHVIASGDSAEVQTLRARALRGLGRLDEAAVAAAAAVKLQPTSGEAWLASGVLAMQRKRLPEASTALETAVAWAPKEVRGWLNLGHVEALRGRWLQSSNAFEAAMALVGDDRAAAQVARMGQMRAWVALKRYDAARRLGLGLLQAGTPLPGLPAQMALVHLAAGELEPAQAAIEAATHFSPKDPETWRVRALVFEAQGNAEAAAAARVQFKQLTQ
jgi:tetratricopeptide (TPR) repeat protein